MSLKPKVPGGETAKPVDTGCLETRDVPGVCLRIESARQKIALPYALLLRVDVAEDQTTCEIGFATHTVTVRGRHLREVYVAVSQGQATQISVGHSANFLEGDAYYGPLITGIQIEPLDESSRARR
ncbi:MAG: hypothetical protein JNG82_03200 [Opitutaceae bacterium]|nr:hypothetical protein [Opitutaceae bacterium]